MRRQLAGLLGAALLAGSLATPASADATPRAPLPLTNLAHLDFLTASVRPPAQPGHTTYRQASDPAIGVLWVYAGHNPDGSFTRTGGGDYDAATNTYGQGAYDADDIARAAVVYLRHWRQFGDVHSRSEAEQLLRGLTYLQDASGPNAGEVVLWMQPDGTLQPSATPADTPNPSDSGDSYWLARTIWALGEGYATFAPHDRAFARFLRTRLDLAVGALRRRSLAAYGRHHRVDGVRTPAWLIVDGADASAEAVLGLAAATDAGVPEARRPLTELADGIAELATPAGPSWPYGAVLPSALSRSSWHAWASLTPAALSSAAAALHRPGLAAGAVADSSSFSPALLTRYGPINGLSPTPSDQAQIAYGVDSRLQSALATAQLTGSSGLRTLAGLYGGWYFGANPSGRPTYDPATGVTVDGVAADGTVNQNSGAESTIHGLLSMLALDAHPALARVARLAGARPVRSGTVVVEGEAASVTGAAAAMPADPASTAESTWSGGALLRSTGPATARWTLPASTVPRRVEAVIDRVPGRAGTLSLDGGRPIAFGGGGAQGDSPAPGALLPVPAAVLPARATTITARLTGPGELDALLVTPLVAAERSGRTMLLANSTGRTRAAARPDLGRVIVRSYDSRGRLRGRRVVTGAGSARVVAGGFTTVVPAGG